MRMDQGPSVRWGFTPTAISNRLVAIGGHSIPQGEALHCQAPNDCSRRPPDRARFLTVRSPVVTLGRHRDLPLRKYKHHSTSNYVTWAGTACYAYFQKCLPFCYLKCDILPSQTRWQNIGHSPESSRPAERLQAPAERVRPHSTAPPPGAWLR
jgi:hypothetical protein